MQELCLQTEARPKDTKSGMICNRSRRRSKQPWYQVVDMIVKDESRKVGWADESFLVTSNRKPVSTGISGMDVVVVVDDVDDED